MPLEGESWQSRYKRRFYESRPEWIDGTREFHRLCAAAIAQGSRILEIGPGPSNPTSRFLSGLGELHGLDPDPAARDNDALETATQLEGDRFPFADESFDACVSNYVLEHIADPSSHLAEVHRVLRRGGLYLFRTPNAFHYVTLVARATPQWFHQLVANRLRNLPSEAHDPYPTVYRCNTRRAVRRLAAGQGFEFVDLRLIEKEPSYGMSSRLLFLTFVAYERIVNATSLTADLRANLLGALRKVN